MELVVEPLSIVGRTAGSVVQYSLASHLVVLKLALVVGAVFKEQFALAMLAAVQDCSFIPPTVLIGLNGEYELVFLLKHGSLSWLLGRHIIVLYSLQLLELQSISLLALTVGETEAWLRADIRRGVAEGEWFGLVVAALACLVKCALFEAVDVFQILPDHLQQARISVEAVLLESRWIFGRG